MGGTGAAYSSATDLEEGDSALETSDVETFQHRRPGTGGQMEFPPDETEQRVNDVLIAVEEALDVPAAPAPEPSTEFLAEIAKLREALAASQAAVADQREAFDEQQAALEALIAEKEAELANLQRQTETRIEGLQAMLDAERAQREGLKAELDREGLIADQRLLEERRRQEEELRQREAERVAEELLTAQIESPALVYAGGPRGGQSGAAVADPAAAGASGPALSRNEQFMQSARPLDVQEAARLTHLERTLTQGYVIQAALLTAINSDLPGSVVAVVSKPVTAFSGDRILIPRGSRLFGQYRSGIEMDQKRILIFWNRVLTPGRHLNGNRCRRRRPPRPLRRHRFS